MLIEGGKHDNKTTIHFIVKIVASLISVTLVKSHLTKADRRCGSSNVIDISLQMPYGPNTTNAISRDGYHLILQRRSNRIIGL